MNTSSYTKLVKSFQKFTADYHQELAEKIVEVLELNAEDKTKLDTMFSQLNVKADMSNGSKNVQKKKREPTAYNLFMKDMIKSLREKHPTIDKTELMKLGAQEWQKQKAAKLANATKATKK